MRILNVLRLRALKIASSIQFYIEVIEVPWGNWSVFHAINWMFNGIWNLFLLIAIMMIYNAFRFVSCIWCVQISHSPTIIWDADERKRRRTIFCYSAPPMLLCVLPQCGPLFRWGLQYYFEWFIYDTHWFIHMTNQ